jgi:hypothetical protein
MASADYKKWMTWETAALIKMPTHHLSYNLISKFSQQMMYRLKSGIFSILSILISWL